MSHLSEVFLLKRKITGLGKSVSLSKSHLSGVPVIESMLYILNIHYFVSVLACEMPDTFQSWFYVMQLHLWYAK